MKGFFVGIAFGLLFVSAVLAQNTPVVRIGYQPSSSVLLVGKSLGFYDQAFEKQGVKVDWDLFLAGPIAMEAAAGDRVDLLGVGNIPPLVGRSGGIDVKIIAKAAFNPATNAVLVRPDSPFHSIGDLKGKKVAVQIGSSVHYFLYQLLTQAGLSLNDVQLVNLAGPDQGPALQSGAVDAIVLWMPYRTQLEQSGQARVLVDSSKVSGNFSFYLTRGSFGQAHPDWVEAFLKATKRSNDYLRLHPKEALAILAKDSRFPRAALAESLRGFHYSMGVTPEDERALGEMKDFLLKTGVLRHDFSLSDLFDRHYLTQAGLR